MISARISSILLTLNYLVLLSIIATCFLSIEHSLSSLDSSTPIYSIFSHILTSMSLISIENSQLAAIKPLYYRQILSIFHLILSKNNNDPIKTSQYVR